MYIYAVRLKTCIIMVELFNTVQFQHVPGHTVSIVPTGSQIWFPKPIKWVLETRFGNQE